MIFLLIKTNIKWFDLILTHLILFRSSTITSSIFTNACVDIAKGLKIDFDAAAKFAFDDSGIGIGIGGGGGGSWGGAGPELAKPVAKFPYEDFEMMYILSKM